jgi:hypothetical protein
MIRRKNIARSTHKAGGGIEADFTIRETREN